MKQKIKAVVFDMDGTLLDTMQDIGAVANKAMALYNFPARPIPAFQDYIGYGAPHMIRCACPDGTPEETVQNVLVDYLALYPEDCAVYTVFYEGVPELLESLEKRGITLGVISNKDEHLVLKVADHYLKDRKFAMLWGNNGVRPIKPALDAGNLACEFLGLTPEEILYVGDGDTDMKFGKAMGFVTVGCTWGYRDGEILKGLGADHLVDRPLQILDLLG